MQIVLKEIGHGGLQYRKRGGVVRKWREHVEIREMFWIKLFERRDVEFSVVQRNDGMGAKEFDFSKRYVSGLKISGMIVIM